MAEGKTGDSNDTAWMYATAAVAAIIVAVPTLIGAGLWLALRHRLARRDWLITAATALVLIVLSFSDTAAGYFSWLGRVAPPDIEVFPIPWWSLACYSALVASILGAMDGTRALAKVSEKMHLSSADTDSVLPTDAQRERVRSKVRSIDAEFFAIDADDHTADNHKMGGRSFTLGLDPTGRNPVRISENEIRTHAVLLGATGSGKALALDTPIPTPSGWTTMGELSTGDWVFDANGKPVQVSFATEVMYGHECFEVVFSDGSTIIADADHRWLTETRASRVSAARARKNEPLRLRRPGDHRDQRHLRELPAVRTTAEIRDTLRVGSASWANHSIPLAGALSYQGREPLPLHPYLLGVLLGDGQLGRSVKLSSADPEIIEEVRDVLPEGVQLIQYDELNWGIVKTGGKTNVVHDHLADLGLIGTVSRTKFVPRRYLEAPIEQRLALLQGLMDSDGHIDSAGSCEFTTVSPQLAEDVTELVIGLGIQATCTKGTATINGRATGPKFRVRFTTTAAVFRLPRKVERLPKTVRDTTQRRYIVDVRPHPSVPVRCIQVDSAEHLYLAGRSCVITHNTETIKNLAGNLGDLGWSVIVLDLKEDTAPGGLRDFCSTYARSHALRYQELALSKRHNELWFNPLFGMTLDEAINTIMSLQTFDDGYWQAVNKTMIGQVCTLFYDAHEVDPDRFPPPDMYAIGRLLRQQHLPEATKEMRAIVLASKPDRHPDDFSALAKPSQAEQQSASGLGSRIVNMFESEAGRGVLRPGEGREVLDVCAGGFVYVGLNTLGLSELARVVSTSALLRLAAYAGARTTGAHTGELVPTAVIIDEANWIDRRQVQNLLSRARSAGIAVVLCTQGPEDWNDENGNDWNTITQNTNVAIIMRQGNEYNAELCAELIGKKAKTSLISQVRDGDVLDSGSITERVDYVVPTEAIRGLRVGEAILKVGVPYERIEYCAVRQRQPDDHSRRRR